MIKENRNKIASKSGTQRTLTEIEPNLRHVRDWNWTVFVPKEPASEQSRSTVDETNELSCRKTFRSQYCLNTRWNVRHKSRAVRRF